MTERKVIKTRKDTDGDITHLCNPGYKWSPRKVKEAIKDIESENYEYYVHKVSPKVYLHIVDDKKKGKYLRTTADKDDDNNLDNLPNC